MTAPLIVDGLHKRYGDLIALRDMTFSVDPGEIFGFVGSNGAGKSTTMRIMVGLTRPTSGSATIEGHQYADLPCPGRDIGVLLDASAQHAGRTGRETLAIAASTVGVPGTS